MVKIRKFMQKKEEHFTKKQIEGSRNSTEKSSGKPAKKQLFDEVQKLWLTQNRGHLKPASERKYRYLLEKHILPVFGQQPVQQISATAINDFLSEKLRYGRADGAGGLSASYVRSMVLIITGVMAFAARMGLCASLTDAINKPAPRPKSISILSERHLVLLNEKLRFNPTATEIGILLALYTGMRIGEICALSWEDVDLENRLITVRHTISRVNDPEQTRSILIVSAPKTAASFRVIPICSSLYTILQKHKKRHCSPYVISDEAAFVSPRTFEYRFHAVLKKYGIPDINFHALRHTFATNCVANQIDVKTLSEILGHSSELITLKTYVHSSIERKKKELEKLSYAP